MRILFDHGTPRSIARWLHGHIVVEAIARGWDRLSNGELLKAAEEAGFDVLLSTDKNIQYQQNLTGRKIAVVILGNPQRPAVHRYIDRVVAAVNAATPGSYAEVDIPFQ
jgi:predicted nuclease of predicted toxin-antitoxin system